MQCLNVSRPLSAQNGQPGPTLCGPWAPQREGVLPSLDGPPACTTWSPAHLHQLFPAVILPCPLLGTREIVLFHDIQADTPLLKHFLQDTRPTDETTAGPSDFSAQGKAQRVEFHLEKVILGLSLLLSVH